MAFNRELSQLGHYIVVDDTTGKIAITSTTSPNVGVGTVDPQYKLDVLGDTRISSDLTVGAGVTVVGVSTFQNKLFIGGDLDFKGKLFNDGQLYTSGVGIGSTTVNAESGDVGYRIGIGFTDVNFVGSGLTITGYGSTVVVDFNNLSVRADATIPPLTLLNSSANLDSNKGYLTNTVGAGFTVTLPLSKNAGDFVEIHDTESSWDINNLMVATQNNEQFKNYTGTIDSPLACDVAGATVKLVWTNTYWRVFA